MGKLRCGLAVNVPNYDFKTHKSKLPARKTILTWIFHADADVRLARRIKRDTVEKGRDIKAVLDQVRISRTLLQIIWFQVSTMSFESSVDVGLVFWMFFPTNKIFN
ncbi:hypothetical protein BHE74_00025302 [Ensete ventricosum]|nr:hypothetical protein BHE74_00025302 [Ensete ventricosum]